MYTDRLEAALESINMGMSREPDDPRCYFVLGEYYDKSGRKDLALDAYNKVLELDPSYGEAFYKIGCIYQDSEEFEKAVDFFTKSIEAGYGSADPYVSRAIVYTNNLGEFVKALEDLDKAAEIEPDDELIPLLRIPAEFNLGNKDICEDALKRVDDSFEKHDKKKN